MLVCDSIERQFFSSKTYAFSGKILTDETVLSEYNIDEKKFIVVMVTKPKQPEKKTETSGDGNTTRLVFFVTEFLHKFHNFVY